MYMHSNVKNGSAFLKIKKLEEHVMLPMSRTVIDVYKTV